MNKIVGALLVSGALRLGGALAHAKKKCRAWEEVLDTKTNKVTMRCVSWSDGKEAKTNADDNPPSCSKGEHAVYGAKTGWRCVKD